MLLLVAWVFSPERLQRVQFSPVLYVENLVSILSIKEKVSSDFKIFTTFEPITWWILVFFIIHFFIEKVSSISSNQIYRISYSFWIFGCFFYCNNVQ